jgi:hypothetical protein
LPTHADYEINIYDESVTPQRLVDNLKSGYAKYYDWTENESSILNHVEDAFNARIARVDNVRNGREQMSYNRPCE